MNERNSEVATEEPEQPEFEGTMSADFEEQDMEFTDTLVLDAKEVESDNVGGSSVEINVEDLLAEVEAESSGGVDASGRVRRRLEAILERKRRHEDLVDFEEYDLDS